MNNLERLAGELLAMLPHEYFIAPQNRAPIQEAAAILLAASKVDVAGLMALFEARQRALDSVRDAKTKDIADKAILRVGYADIALETALRMALAGRQEWRPIESAPKDGSVIVLGNGHGRWVGKYLPVFVSGYKPDNPWSSLMLNHYHMNYVDLVPTHWMPLPPAPKGEQT